MAKKCFIVGVKLETAVWAETPEEAKQIADREHAFEDDLRNIDSSFDYDAAPATYVPCGYDNDSLVYGAPDDMTVIQALEQTPEYVEANKHHEAMMAKATGKVAGSSPLLFSEMDPIDLTGGIPSEDYVRRLRDGE